MNLLSHLDNRNKTGERPKKIRSAFNFLSCITVTREKPTLTAHGVGVNPFMKAVIQRVKSAAVSVDNKEISHIGAGLLVFLGVSVSDEASDADFLSDKIVNLRIFEDDNGKMNRSVIDTSGAILVVSQFTLYGDCRKGRRPSFIQAAPPEKAEALYTYFIEQIKTKKIAVQSGKFRAMMAISLVNDGPVTLIVESKIES